MKENGVLQGEIEWHTVKAGAGGACTGGDANEAGVVVINTDVANGYAMWSNDDEAFETLFQSSNLPDNWDDLKGTQVDGPGVYAVAAGRKKLGGANSSRIAGCYWNRVLIRDGKEGKFRCAINLPQQPFPPNAGFYKSFAPKLMFDQHNDNVLYVVSHSLTNVANSKVFRTLNAQAADGGTWTQITGLPALPDLSGEHTYLVHVDPSSSLTGSGTEVRHSVVYISVDGSPVYASVDGGNTFQPMPGSPTNVAHISIGTDGVGWFTDQSNGSRIMRYKNGSWTVSTTGWFAEANPADPQHVFAYTGYSAREWKQTRDGGANWTGQQSADFNDPLVGWLDEHGQAGYMSACKPFFRPSQTTSAADNKLFHSEGTGVWAGSVPAHPADAVWTGLNGGMGDTGIEVMGFNDLIMRSGADPVFFGWDRPAWVINDPDRYPPTYYGGFSHSWQGSSPPGHPNFIVDVRNYSSEESSYTTDGGRTWTKYPYAKPFKKRGLIEAATPDLWVRIDQNGGYCYYTRNKGQDGWPLMPFNGFNTGADTGAPWGATDWYGRRLIVHDDALATPGTFYIYHIGVDGTGPNAGLYKAVFGPSGPPVITKVFAGEPANWQPWASNNACKLIQVGKTVAPQAGKLMWTTAEENAPLVRSNNGGANWTVVPGVTGVQQISFGKALKNAVVPYTIFIEGKVNGVRDSWRSDDDGQTWVPYGQKAKMGKLPAFDTGFAATSFAGHPDRYGELWGASNGGGSVRARYVYEVDVI